jgi:acyl-CoA oxidase
MLMPTIAYMYATKCVGDKIGKDWDGFMNAQSTMNAKEWMGRLHDYHAVVSGLKALLGWRGAEQLEQIRLSMGGHAYHQFNAVPGIVADYGVLTTGGGDNTPLAQQTAKYLVASLQRVAKGSTVSGSVHYLNKHEAILVTASKGNKIEDFLNKEAIHSNLTFLATKLISHAAQRLLFDTAEGKAMSEAWNDNMMILIAASNAHSELYLYESFDAAVQQQRQHDSIYKPLSRLVQLLGLDIVVRSIDRLLEFEYLVPAQIFALREAVRALDELQ